MFVEQPKYQLSSKKKKMNLKKKLGKLNRIKTKELRKILEVTTSDNLLDSPESSASDNQWMVFTRQLAVYPA